MKMPFLEPYASIARYAVVGLPIIAMAALTWSWYSRGQEIARLETWQDQVVTATARAADRARVVKPGDVVDLISTLGADLRASNKALDDISAEADRAKRVSDARDAGLRTALEEAQKRNRAASQRIDALEHRGRAGSSGEATVQIEEDSKAAWQGWTQ